ncbi:MAG TPA: hypothetical protein PLX99_10110 [Gammaproteobacteria bacterium]|nr:hypothetical protein [Gammaproteobacteria bacterium]
MGSRYSVHCIALLALLLHGACTAQDAPPEAQPVVRIQLHTARLAAVARQVRLSDATVQWDLANIALDVLLESYRQELQTAASEKASTAGRRAKLASWRSGTRELIARLEASHARLADGAALGIQVDARDQVLIVIDGQPIAISALRPDAEQAIDEQVLARFCGYNDCSVLTNDNPTNPRPTEAAAGAWNFAPNRPPTFEIGELIRCEFPGTDRRLEKSAACKLVAEEALQLAARLDQVREKGYRIDRALLSDITPTHLANGQIVVNRDGAFIDVPTRMLSRLDRADLQRLIEWLPLTATPNKQPLVIQRANRLLGDASRRP